MRTVHGPGVDAPLASVDGAGVASYYLADHLGSIVQQTDASQQVTLTRQYDPWGTLTTGDTTSGYAFTGREWDAEDSLYYFRARYDQDPDDAWAHFYAAQTKEVLGDLLAARQAYESAVELAPRESAFVVGLADVIAKLGDRGRADELFLRALELDTSYLMANRQYGLFLERSGYLSRAERYLERVLAHDAGDDKVKQALERIRAAGPSRRDDEAS